MDKNPVLDAIYTRRSVRNFLPDPVSDEAIKEIIKAGTWAPSGLNNQPWRFAIVRDIDLKNKLAECTRYGHIIINAPALIVVFVDKDAMYNATKDHQSMGACLQNMLLATHSLGYGGVWLGEILKNAAKVNEILGLEENLDLMAVIALGAPKNRDQKSMRKNISELVILEK